jgi:hypothetical protein
LYLKKGREKNLTVSFRRGRKKKASLGFFGSKFSHPILFANFGYSNVINHLSELLSTKSLPACLPMSLQTIEAGQLVTFITVNYTTTILQFPCLGCLILLTNLASKKANVSCAWLALLNTFFRLRNIAQSTLGNGGSWFPNENVS